MAFALPFRARNYVDVYDYSKGWVSLGVSFQPSYLIFNRQHLFVLKTFMKVYIYDERNHKLIALSDTPEKLLVNEFGVLIKTISKVKIYDSLRGRLLEFTPYNEVLLDVKLNDPDLFLYNYGYRDFAQPMGFVLTDKRYCFYSFGDKLYCKRRESYYSPLEGYLNDSIGIIVDGFLPLVFDPLKGEFIRGELANSQLKVFTCLGRGALAISSEGAQVFDPVKGQWDRILGFFSSGGCDLRGAWVSNSIGDTKVYVYGKGWIR